MTSRNLLASIALTGALSTASAAQVINVVSHQRFIEGTTVSVTDGVETILGPFREEVPSDIFGQWPISLAVPGTNMTVSGMIDAEYNFDNAITINTFSMNFSGGGGPGTSGNGTLTSRCAYTFTVPEASTFTINGLFGSGPFVVVTFTLVGPDVNFSFDTSSGANVVFKDFTGALAPGGEYTLALEGTGAVEYIGPGGNGSGAGGGLPVLHFSVAAGGGCRADFNGDGAANSQDFFDFLAAFFASDPAADFNADGNVNSQDFFDFLGVFFVGS